MPTACDYEDIEFALSLARLSCFVITGDSSVGNVIAKYEFAQLKRAFNGRRVIKVVRLESMTL